MLCSAVSVAKEFFRLSNLDNQPVDNLKLTKLVYFAHGWYLAVHDTPLLTELVQAWDYGPVIPSLQQHLQGRVLFPSAVFRSELDISELPLPSQEKWRIINLIKCVWNEYKGFSGILLANYTHMKGSPWDQWYEEDKTFEIPNCILRDYFKSLIKC